MARTRCGESVSAKVKLNFPAASVLAWPTSSIPAPSLMRMTSSPVDGLLEVPLVIFPVKVAADKKEDEPATRTNASAKRNPALAINFVAPCVGRISWAEQWIPAVRFPPGLRRLPLRAKLSSSDSQLREPCRL